MLNNTTNYSFFTILFSLFINCTKKLPISSITIILEMDSSDYFFSLLNYIVCVCVCVCYSPNVFRFCSFSSPFYYFSGSFQIPYIEIFFILIFVFKLSFYIPYKIPRAIHNRTKIIPSIIVHFFNFPSLVFPLFFS